MNPQLLQVAISVLPTAIAWLREQFTTANPDAPVPTDAEVTAAYQSALASSLAKDDLWLAAHPESQS